MLTGESPGLVLARQHNLLSGWEVFDDFGQMAVGFLYGDSLHGPGPSLVVGFQFGMLAEKLSAEFCPERFVISDDRRWEAFDQFGLNLPSHFGILLQIREKRAKVIGRLARFVFVSCIHP